MKKERKSIGKLIAQVVAWVLDFDGMELRVENICRAIMLKN